MLTREIWATGHDHVGAKYAPWRAKSQILTADSVNYGRNLLLFQPKMVIFGGPLKSM